MKVSTLTAPQIKAAVVEACRKKESEAQAPCDQVTLKEKQTWTDHLPAFFVGSALGATGALQAVMAPAHTSLLVHAAKTVGEFAAAGAIGGAGLGLVVGALRGGAGQTVTVTGPGPEDKVVMQVGPKVSRGQEALKCAANFARTGALVAGRVTTVSVASSLAGLMGTAALSHLGASPAVAVAGWFATSAVTGGLLNVGLSRLEDKIEAHFS